jgi:hypothetical protein
MVAFGIGTASVALIDSQSRIESTGGRSLKGIEKETP